MAIVLIFAIFDIHKMEFKWIAKSCLPIAFDVWWFASTYTVLYLLHPYINKLICQLKKEEYRRLLLTLLILWSFLPTALHVGYQSNNLCWFITVYLIAGYLKLHIDCHKYSAAFIAVGGVAAFVLMMLSGLYNQEHITTVVVTLSIFFFFIRFKEKNISWINKVAGYTFGVYLLHDHPISRKWIWNLSLPSWLTNRINDSVFLIFDSIIKVVLIYLLCTFVAAIMKKIVDCEVAIVRYIQNKIQINAGRG